MLRGETEIDPVESSDCGARLPKRALIYNHVVRNLQALVATRLRGNDAPSLLNGFRISLEQTTYLRFLITVDDEHAIHEFSQWRPG